MSLGRLTNQLRRIEASEGILCHVHNSNIENNPDVQIWFPLQLTSQTRSPSGYSIFYQVKECVSEQRVEFQISLCMAFVKFNNLNLSNAAQLVGGCLTQTAGCDAQEVPSGGMLPAVRGGRGLLPGLLRKPGMLTNGWVSPYGLDWTGEILPNMSP